MKAKEYVEKTVGLFRERTDESNKKAIEIILFGLLGEISETAKKLKNPTLATQKNFILQYHQKWIAIGNRLERELGFSVLNPNGFLEYQKREIPEVNSILNSNKKYSPFDDSIEYHNKFN